MRIAAITLMWMVVAISAGLILGFCSGVLSVQGTEVRIQYDGPVGLYDTYFYDISMTTSIYVFVAILGGPLVLLAILAIGFVSRSSWQRS